MDNEYVYMDYNATTPIDLRVLKEMDQFSKDYYYNPSSIYNLASKTKEIIENARLEVASLINAKAKEIIFTAGGTESDNLAIIGYAYKNREKGKHLITSSIEHPAVLKSFSFLQTQGFKVDYINPKSNGIIEIEDLKKLIKEDTILVSIMHANNEIGSIQNLQKIGALLKSKNIAFHTDAVQSVGKIPIDVNKLNVDLLSFSSHKIYGPKGVGALYIRNGIEIAPIIHGGSHENGLRSGTENTSGIIGFAKACKIVKKEMGQEESQIRNYRDKIEKFIKEEMEEIRINGEGGERLYNTLNISVTAVDGEALLGMLETDGFLLSTASACSAHSCSVSHVLQALGVDGLDAHGTLRISLGKYNKKEDIDRFIKSLKETVYRLRQMSPLWHKK